MSTRQYSATLSPVADHGSPTPDWLDVLVDTIAGMPDECFSENPHADIYANLAPVLGPYTNILQRRAVMCEGLRVLAGFESSWNWQEGEDMSAPRGRPLSEIESGAFQESANSLAFDSSLAACLLRYAGAVDAETFIREMKAQPDLCVEYTARLTRFTVKTNGPLISGRVREHVNPAAVAEFMGFFTPAA